MSNKIYIPIGIDCTIAEEIKKKNKRTNAYPFDWVVTYNGVTDIIKNKFINYLPDNNTIQNYKSHTLFLHNNFPADNEKMNRRINRFMDLLNNKTDEIIFFRKSHCYRHHKEVENSEFQLKNDLDDSIELYDYLKANYSELKFKIIIILMCGKCFDKTMIYDTTKVEVYNNSELYDDKNNLFKIIDDILI